MNKTNTKQNWTEHEKGDYIYYNITVRNEETSDRTINAVFSENRIVSVLTKPSEYQLAVVRFKIPTTNIPIFIYPRPGEPQFAVSLEYDGYQTFHDLIFVPNADPASAKVGNAIYSYQEIADQINVGLASAFADIQFSTASTVTEAPYVVYNSESGLFSLFAQQAYADAPIETKIYFNTRLHSLFPTFQTFALRTSVNPPTTFWQILVKDNKNNTPTSPANYYEMKQENSSLGIWSGISSIAFETTAIPVEQELQGTQANIQRSIITDFEPSVDLNDRQSLQYQPSGGFRWFDLDSKQELRRIDLNAIWTDKEGRDYTISISPGDSFTVKILFRKKRELALSEILHADDENLL